MQPFVGQIQTFGFNFSPRGWAKCNGQLLAISQNDALFSLLGTIYGGDGRTTFGLPDFRGRVMVHEGSGPGLSPRPIGQKSGTASNFLNLSQLPAHNHGVRMPVTSSDATTPEASGNTLAKSEFPAYASTASAGESYRSFSTAAAGNSSEMNNLQPYLTMNVCIALLGIYPSRN